MTEFKLQHFALKPEPRINLKALRSNAFKFILVVRLIGNGCRSHPPQTPFSEVCFDLQNLGFAEYSNEQERRSC